MNKPDAKELAMHAEQLLARDRHREHLQRAQDERAAQQLSELRKLERRQERAERNLLHAWQRVERLRVLLGAAG
ncbi:MAG TPA: hypothetical protein VGD91_31365 [Trebonia sp.]